MAFSFWLILQPSFSTFKYLFIYEHMCRSISWRLLIHMAILSFAFATMTNQMCSWHHLAKALLDTYVHQRRLGHRIEHPNGTATLRYCFSKTSIPTVWLRNYLLYMYPSWSLHDDRKFLLIVSRSLNFGGVHCVGNIRVLTCGSTMAYSRSQPLLGALLMLLTR